MGKVLSELKSEYDQKKFISEKRFRDKQSALFVKYPELKNIQSRISAFSIKYTEELLKAKNKDEILLKKEQYKAGMNKLISQKKALFYDAKVTDEFFNDCYECPGCKDSGYIKDEKGRMSECACFTKEKLRRLFKFSNFPLLENQRFENVDITLFSDKPDEKKYRIKKSPRENMAAMVDRCKAFVADFEKPGTKSLFFTGTAGVGKTFLSGCIANEIIKKGFSVLYICAVPMFDMINEHKAMLFNNAYDDDFKYRYIFDCNLLIIDDLGTENFSSSKYAELLNILESRISADGSGDSNIRKTVISTNLSMENIYKTYTERVGSRITGNFDIYRFGGDDLRYGKI